MDETDAKNINITFDEDEIFMCFVSVLLFKRG
jgi:hypothetical protein